MSLWSRIRGSKNNVTEQKLHVLNFKGSGTLAPVVLLHGISSCASDYYPLIMFLQTKCSRVIAIDLPGHGKTVVRKDCTLSELENLMIAGVDICLKKLKVGQCTLIGNSLGGFVAAKYASLHSNNLRSLVLISPAGAPLTKDELDAMRKIFRMETFDDALKFLDVVFGRQRLPIGMRQVISLACRARARRPSVQRILQEATISTRLSVREVSKIKCPTLLIWGEKEQIFGDDHLEWFSKNLRPQLIYRPKGIGHVPHLDPKIIANSIFTFLKSNGKYYD
jgi:pimeloyl-ACP methyl ester carboxylesterase